MTADARLVRLDRVAVINPARRVSKGQLVPFIDMAALPQHARDISSSDIAERAAKCAGAHFRNGDTLLARITPCLENGKTAQVRSLRVGEVGEGSTEFIVVAGIEEADNDFVRDLCRDQSFREYALGRMQGTSGRQRVAWQSIAEYQFACPTSVERRAAAEMLSALDDRIALIRETNATLEAIAQALFKSWFIDFGPVRAKQQGLAPAGMDEATAALFPGDFDGSAIAALPAGWRVATLADAFEINPGRALKKGAVSPYLDMASVATSGHCVDRPVVREFGSGMKFCNGDTLLARITPCLENGKCAFVDFLDSGQVGWGSTEFVVLRPKSPLPDYFGYLLARHPPFRTYAIHSMSGTSGRQRVQNDVLGRYVLAVPSVEVAIAFAETVAPVQLAIAANHARAQTLATLRDTLLPRMISGQLRLPEAVAEADKATA